MQFGKMPYLCAALSVPCLLVILVKSLLRNILFSLCALLIVAGYGMSLAHQYAASATPVACEQSAGKQHKKETSPSDTAPGATKISAVHASAAIGVFAPSPAVLAEQLAVSEPVFCTQTAATSSSHQVEGRFLLSYFFKLFKSAIQGMAP